MNSFNSNSNNPTNNDIYNTEWTANNTYTQQNPYTNYNDNQYYNNYDYQTNGSNLNNYNNNNNYHNTYYSQNNTYYAQDEGDWNSNFDNNQYHVNSQNNQSIYQHHHKYNQTDQHNNVMNDDQTIFEKKENYYTEKPLALSYENIPIKVISDMKALQSAVKELVSYSPLYLGIDLEWKPNFIKKSKENKVCIIQIASKHLIIIIRLNKLNPFNINLRNLFFELVPNLLSLLANPSILKLGVGIVNDAVKLNKDWRIEMKGCVELNYLYKLFRNAYIHWLGLNNLCIKVLKYEMIYKNNKIKLSNWESPNDDLSLKQILYAAEDAAIGLIIFEKLVNDKYGENNWNTQELQLILVKVNNFHQEMQIKKKNKRKATK